MGDAEKAKQEFDAVLQIAKRSSGYVLREPFSHFQLAVLALQQQPPDTVRALEELKATKQTYRWAYMPTLYKYLAIAEALAGNRAAARSNLEKELFLLGVGAGGQSTEQAPETADLSAR